MTKPILRDYQRTAASEVLAHLDGGRCTLLVAPTGSGKTIMFADVAATYAASGLRVLIVAHRRELLTQAHDKLSRAGVEASIYRGKRAPFTPSNVVVASVQTGAPPGFDANLLVIDEAHHAPADGYRRLVVQQPNAVVLGATATPWWQSSRPLDDLFPATVRASNVRDLTAAGHLARVRMFTHPHTLRDLDLRGVATAAGDYAVGAVSGRVDKPALLGDMVEHWRSHARGARTLAFAASVEHSRHIAQRFNAVGIRAEHLDGKTPDAERTAILARLASGETRIVCNYGILGEGFDAPAVGCVILARPTKRVGVYLQCAGRGMRPGGGFDDVVVLDHAGSCIAFGLPDEDRTINGPEPRSGKAAKSRVIRCPLCGMCAPLGTKWCPECSASLRRPVPMEEPTGVLVEVVAEVLRGRRKITHDGVTLSVPAWAARIGVSESLIQERLSSGASAAEALAPSKFGPRKVFTFNGKTQSIAAWARDLGCRVQAIYKRLARGATTEEALAPTARNYKTVTLNGVTKTFRQWSDELGIKEATLRVRLDNGWAPEDVVAPLVERRQRELTHDGRTQTVDAWADEVGITRGTIYARLKDGLPVGDVLAKGRRKPQPRGRTRVVAARLYPSGPSRLSAR